MKRFLYLMLAMAMLASFGCSGDTTVSSSQQGTDTISGVLRDPATNAPIAGAVIKNGNATCTTDAQGMWTLGGFTIPTGGGRDAATNNLQFIVSVVPPTGKGYPAQVFRTVFGSATAVNNLTIGMTNATARGVICNADGSPAVGASVYLVYATDSDAQGAGTAAGTVYTFNQTQTATTNALGEFTINNVETGASVIVVAQSSNGAFSGMWPTANPVIKLANTNNFVNNLNAQWGGAGVVANGNQPFRFAATTDINLPAVVLLPTMTLNGAAVSTVNNGEFAPGNVVITYAFSKGLPLNSYMNSPNFTNDMFVEAVNKGVNIPVKVELIKENNLLTGVKVSFATGDSMQYTVDLGASTAAASDGTVKANSFLNKLGFAQGAATDSRKVVFTTYAKAGPTIAPKLTWSQNAANGTDYAKNCTISWPAVTNAFSYRIFVNKVIMGTSSGYIEVLKTTATSINIATELNKIPQIDPVTGKENALYNANRNGAAPGSIFFQGANKVSYDVKVYAVNKDGALDEKLSSELTKIVDTTGVEAMTDGTEDRLWTNAMKTEAKKSKDGEETITGYLFGKDIYRKVTVDFYADPLVNALFEQMDPSITAASLGVLPPVGDDYFADITGNTTARNKDVTYVIEIKPDSVKYENMKMTFEYNIKYSIDAPAKEAAPGTKDAKDTIYTLTPQSAAGHLFTIKGAKDLNGNAVFYPSTVNKGLGF